MKRRVLRLHSNKKALRLLASTHHLRPPYHVVCDASFVRAFAAREKVRRVVDVVGEALGVPCDVCCIPETALALERQEQQLAIEKQQQAQAQKIAAAKKGKAVRAPAHSSDVNSGVNGVLKQLCHVGRLHDPPKNELKAVCAYTQANSSASAAGEKRFVFVATASYDLKKLIATTSSTTPAAAKTSQAGEPTVDGKQQQQPANESKSCAFIRLTFNPTAAWLDTLPTPGTPRSAGSSGRAERPVRRSAQDDAARLLSPADRAFMQHLNVQPGGRKQQRVKRQREVVGNGAAASPTPAPAEIQKKCAASSVAGPGSSGPVVASPAAHLSDSAKKAIALQKKKKPAAPNPLSMKKRRVRETLVVGAPSKLPEGGGTAQPAAKKHRTETAK